MTERELQTLKSRFTEYVNSFYSSNQVDNENIALKVRHTYNVCENIRQISQEGLGEIQIPGAVLIAEAIALFHDIGRFPQYARYKTFKDSISINHASLGAKTLIENNLLQGLSEYEKDIIVQTVKFHNTFTIPDIEDKYIGFLKLIRDADKLDIWRVFVEFYETPEKERASAVAHGLPDTPEYTEALLYRIYNRQMLSYSSLRTLNDFKLMNLSWVYDINLKKSLELLMRRDYISRIIQQLPQTREIKKMSTFIHQYIQERMKGA